MIKFRHILPLMLVALIAASLSSCVHRELVDSSNMHYIRVYLDEQIKNVTYGFYNETYEAPTYTRPINMRAVLASPKTGEVVSETVLRHHDSDSRGHYIDGYIGGYGGEYNLYVYHLGSPITHIRNADNCYEIQAFTDKLSERYFSYIPSLKDSLDVDRILEEPEHFLAMSYKGVKVPLSTSLDTLTTSSGDYFSAQSIVKSYYLQLYIQGVEWVRAAGAVISGVSGSFSIGDTYSVVESDSAHVFFTMNYDNKVKRIGKDVYSAVIYSTFQTFGRLSEANSKNYLNLEFFKIDGTTQVETIDITEVFNTTIAIENQWILLENEIIITRPEGAEEMGPGVEGWDDIEADIPM